MRKCETRYGQAHYTLLKFRIQKIGKTNNDGETSKYTKEDQRINIRIVFVYFRIHFAYFAY